MKKALSIIMVMCIAIGLFAGCSSLTGAINESKLIGTWECEKETGLFGTTVDLTYTFEEDGKGSMPLLDSGIGVDVNFTYTVEEDILTIKVESDLLSRTDVYTMVFEDDVLTLTDDSGEVLELTKVEE